MGEELQVVVQQEVGVISWNFEQLKTALAEKMQEYDGLVYTEDTVKTAKTDIAALRKIKKVISDKRIEVKKMCLEPYEIFEKQAGELTELVDKPINQIDVQLTEYENSRREIVHANILAYFDEFGSSLLPDAILKQVKALKYTDKWENATTSVKRWKQGVEDAIRAAGRDLKWIDETVEDEFKEMAVDTYARKLQLTDVMEAVTMARKQKEAILAKERERIAAEERAKAEAEACAKIEAEARAKTEVEKQSKIDTPPNARECVEMPSKMIDATIPQQTVPNANLTHSRDNGRASGDIYTLRIKADDAQIRKIKGYIEHVGALYREV